MVNLKEETLEFLEECGKTVDDIEFIAGKDFYIDKDVFWELSDVTYYGGFGSQKVAEDLVIVGDNWWLERFEYDGLEEWVFKTIPVKPKKFKNVKCLTVGQYNNLFTNKENLIGWATLDRVNNGGFK